MNIYIKILYNKLKNYNLNWNMFSKTFILLLLIFMLIFILLYPNSAVGESPNYMLSSLSLESRFTLRITEEDVDRARIVFPTHYNDIKRDWDRQNFAISKKDNTTYSWYFGTYSFLCIPMIKILRILKLNQAYAFPLSNVFFFIISLIYVFLKLKASEKTVFLSILFLGCSPIIAYLYWTSAEVLIFSFVTISVVNLINKNHKLAALYISLAGTLNLTVMVIGFAIIIDYFWIIIENTESKRISTLLKSILIKKIDIIILAAFFTPILIVVLYNFIIFNSIVPVIAGQQINNIFGRFFAYLFDLNLGFLPYFQISLIIFILLIIYGIIKLKREAFIFALSFFGTIFSFSFMSHINCGMTGISRYTAWLSPVLILFVSTQISYIFVNRIFIKKILITLISISITITAIMSTYALIEKPYEFDFSPTAKFILNNMPFLYNPFPYTFISRSQHIDGGYLDLQTTSNPIFYTDDNGFIRKILVPVGISQSVDKWFFGINQEKEQELINSINIKIENIKLSKEYIYININKKFKIRPIFDWDYSFNPEEDNNLAIKNIGIHGHEQTFHWLSADAQITLKEGDKKEKGITIVYNSPLPLIPFINKQQLKTDIYINDVLIDSIIIVQSAWDELNELFIKGIELPDSINGYYIIRLVTNGFWNPSGVYNSHNERNLTIQLFYIG